MIENFKCKETQKIFKGIFSKKLPAQIQEQALIKLHMLDSAQTIFDLKIPPSNFLEKLTGNRKGQYSIRINKQYRVCFEWKENMALNVEIADYH